MKINAFCRDVIRALTLGSSQTLRVDRVHCLNQDKWPLLCAGQSQKLLHFLGENRAHAAARMLLAEMATLPASSSTLHTTVSTLYTKPCCKELFGAMYP
ncbi:hypothetical protein RRG08_027615 [Elysia crispata]|uniref:Uncharacterized protein n=1 Tax=Elysia crispata TaxID=231223 RepID=A0AAE1DXI3_9GAST|nr:hypothetical protein RRG08_027615 [Elysia crispata]